MSKPGELPRDAGTAPLLEQRRGSRDDPTRGDPEPRAPAPARARNRGPGLAGPVAVDIRAGHKFFIGGQNGCGKSTLATEFASRLDRVLVYDPKIDPAAEIPNAAIVTTADAAVRALPGRVLYRPQGVESDEAADRFDRICGKILDDARAGRGATAIVVHELMFLATSYRAGPRFRELIVGGRSLGITCILVSQRPVGVPVWARSEAQHMACFTLLDPDDRREMAALMGPAIAPAPLPLDFSWWYRGPDLRLHLAAPVRQRA